jgi:hypothetical protein
MMSLGIAMVGLQATAEAESVDSELVILVEVTNRALNPSEFAQVMEGYATAITSSQVLDSIQSGTYGRIAVSLMFYGNASTQVVGIPWMMVGSAAEAEQFATLARGVSRPTGGGGAPAVPAALAAAALSFGSETGGAGNGFESSTQIIEIGAGSVPSGGPLASGAIAAARDSALASGVELINAIGLGNRGEAIATYYATHVIGGEAGGVIATSSSTAIGGGLAGALSGQLSGGFGAGAAASLSSIPEPSTAFALMSGLALLLIRRRQI